MLPGLLLLQEAEGRHGSFGQLSTDKRGRGRNADDRILTVVADMDCGCDYSNNGCCEDTFKTFDGAIAIPTSKNINWRIFLPSSSSDAAGAVKYPI